MNRMLLIVLDGWGHRDDKNGNAIAHAHIPFYNRLWQNYSHAKLEASGTWVGLPEGQIGSSEVGHMIMGAGRNVPQLSTIITGAIRSGQFLTNPALGLAMDHALKAKRTLHLIGLTSDGGVHSFWEHLTALLKMAKQKGLGKNQLAVHVILDGRDVGPKTGKDYIEKLKKELLDLGIGRIATVTGRYWIMDRDKRWERTAKAYRALVLGDGARARAADAAIGESYYAGKTDEFMDPTVIVDAWGPLGLIKDEDAVIMYNFRADRMRQIVRSLGDPAFKEFPREKMPLIKLVCMTQYDATFNFPVAFGPQTAGSGAKIPSLPEILEEKDIPQLRIAESEKYAHVTYFFSGGRETPFASEERILVASPKVATYDQAPEMSAEIITNKLLTNIERYPFALINFANADMVGHTGIFEAAVKACECVDRCLEKIFKTAENLGGCVIVTADHGNSEIMQTDGEPHTSHTTSPVPFILWSKEKKNLKLRQDAGGSLQNIAPTILELMGLEQPKGMGGQSLIT